MQLVMQKGTVGKAQLAQLAHMVHAFACFCCMLVLLLVMLIPFMAAAAVNSAIEAGTSAGRSVSASCPCQVLSDGVWHQDGVQQRMQTLRCEQQLCLAVCSTVYRAVKLL